MKSQKHLFSIDADIHYLNCAYKAPMLNAAEEVAIDCLQRNKKPWTISSSDFFTDSSQVRNLFSQLIYSSPANVAIIPSTTYGFSTALNNIKGKKKGFCICVENAFPSTVFSIQRWMNNHDNDCIIIPQNPTTMDDNWNTRILNAITDKTSIVMIPSVHWMTGFCFDLKSIGNKCAHHNAIFIVDGSQSVGALPINVKEFKIHALMCAGYKWLFGPYSIALAYFSDEFNEGIPLEESWMNRTNAHDFSQLTTYESTYTSKAGRYNVGQSSHLLSMPMLQVGLEQILAWNPAYIQQFTGKLIEPLFSYLSNLGNSFEYQSLYSNHLMSLSLPLSINESLLKQKLKENKVFVSYRGDVMRVSVNVFNDKKDIDKLIEVIDSFVK